MKSGLIGLGLGLAVAMTATHAEAHKWYIWEADTNKCVTGRQYSAETHTPAATPYQFEMYARRIGVFADVDTRTGLVEPDGSPRIVGIIVQLPGAAKLELVYFRDPAECALATALAPSPDQLN